MTHLYVATATADAAKELTLVPVLSADKILTRAPAVHAATTIVKADHTNACSRAAAAATTAEHFQEAVRQVAPSAEEVIVRAEEALHAVAAEETQPVVAEEHAEDKQ